MRLEAGRDWPLAGEEAETALAALMYPFSSLDDVAPREILAAAADDAQMSRLCAALRHSGAQCMDGTPTTVTWRPWGLELLTPGGCTLRVQHEKKGGQSAYRLAALYGEGAGRSRSSTSMAQAPGIRWTLWD